MNNQSSLFDAPPITISALSGKAVEVRARTTDPKTSHKAAERASKSAHTIRALTLIALDGMGQATADQVRDRLRQNGHAVSDSGPRSRIKDLRDDGYVRVARHTTENQAVYATTDRGRTAANDLRQSQRETA